MYLLLEKFEHLNDSMPSCFPGGVVFHDYLSGKTMIFHGYVCWSVIFRW